MIMNLLFMRQKTIKREIMNGFKGTRGEAKFINNETYCEISCYNHEVSDRFTIVSSVCAINKYSRGSFEANANLIVDAFKVRQQINCELSDLLEQNKEMLAVLERFIKNNMMSVTADEEAEQLIKKVKQNANQYNNHRQNGNEKYNL